MKVFALAVLLCASMALAQTGDSLPSEALQKGSLQMGFWANGGHSAGSGIRPSEVFESGFRVGVVLLDQHGHGWYRGALEYSADFIPVLLLRAQDRTAYGISFNPVLLRWNFTNHKKISPFFEMGAGVVLTNHVIPEFGS